MSLLIRGARVVTPGSGDVPRRGRAMSVLDARTRSDVLVQDGRIAGVGAGLPSPQGARVIEARGRVLLPGMIDCHTHACFDGSRLDEWERRLAGESYLDILKGGGGIMSTVRATRDASRTRLSELLSGRLARMADLGTTTVEVKSGYGLTTEHELKMLRAISDAAGSAPISVVPTALLGHAIDPGVQRERFVRGVIEETLPAVAKEFPGISVDAYCEQGAWTLDECRRLFDKAASLGCPCRVHADQFHCLGVTGAAGAWGLRTVDHLEATTPADLAALAGCGAIGVLLPCSGLHTDRRFADGRALVGAGGAAAVATNFNPGTGPCLSMPTALALAVRCNGLTPAEAITAGTVNAAAALGLADRGRIEPGLRGDLVLLHASDERALTHDLGENPCDVVIANGAVIRSR